VDLVPANKIYRKSSRYGQIFRDISAPEEMTKLTVISMLFADRTYIWSVLEYLFNGFINYFIYFLELVIVIILDKSKLIRTFRNLAMNCSYK